MGTVHGYMGTVHGYGTWVRYISTVHSYSRVGTDSTMLCCMGMIHLCDGDHCAASSAYVRA